MPCVEREQRPVGLPVRSIKRRDIIQAGSLEGGALRTTCVKSHSVQQNKLMDRVLSIFLSSTQTVGRFQSCVGLIRVVQLRCISPSGADEALRGYRELLE